jgi:hypothetical protein
MLQPGKDERARELTKPILHRGRRRTTFILIEERVNRYPQNRRMLAWWYVDIYNLKPNTSNPL